MGKGDKMSIDKIGLNLEEKDWEAPLDTEEEAKRRKLIDIAYGPSGMERLEALKILRHGYGLTRMVRAEEILKEIVLDNEIAKEEEYQKARTDRDTETQVEEVE